MTHAVLLLSTADTELLAARACGAASGAGGRGGALYRTANPARVEPDGLPALLDGVSLVVLRLLGGRRAWPEGVAALQACGLPVVLLGGEAAPDAELMAASTVPAGVASEALAYLAAGGTDNLRELHRFLSDTVLLTGEGFEPPVVAPDWGVLERPSTGTGGANPSPVSSTVSERKRCSSRRLSTPPAAR